MFQSFLGGRGGRVGGWRVWIFVNGVGVVYVMLSACCLSSLSVFLLFGQGFLCLFPLPFLCVALFKVWLWVLQTLQVNSFILLHVIVSKYM